MININLAIKYTRNKKIQRASRAALFRSNWVEGIKTAKGRLVEERALNVGSI